MECINGGFPAGRPRAPADPVSRPNAPAKRRRGIPYTLNPISYTLQAVAAGDFHTLALTPSGDVYAWGSNQYGQVHPDSEQRWRILKSF